MMMRSETIMVLLLAFMTTLVSGQFCSLGWPVIFGPASKDGDTEVTVWTETPNEIYYLIAGTTNSKDFSDGVEGSSSFLVLWNKLTQEFEQKWLLGAGSQVIDLKFEPYDSVAGDINFALILKWKDGTSTLSINRWNNNMVTHFSTNV